MARYTVTHNKEPVGAEDLEFETIREEWNTYRASDGSIIKLKTIVGKITRLDKYNEDGEPIYLVKSSSVVSAIVPAGLRKNT